jgi:hypothetical protein
MGANPSFSTPFRSCRGLAVKEERDVSAHGGILPEPFDSASASGPFDMPHSRG